MTITKVIPANSPDLPAFVRGGNSKTAIPTEFFAACKEWLAGTYRQMSVFYGRVGHDLVFSAPGHPRIRAHFNGHTVSSGDGRFQAYGLVILPEDKGKIVAGVAYQIEPVNTSDTYRWQVSDRILPVTLRE